MCLVLPSMYDFIPLIAAGALPFSIGKKYQNPTAAPAAMKGSAKARTVIAAPVKAGGTVIKGLCP